MQDRPDSESSRSAPDTNQLPFVAPCRNLGMDAPLRWIRLGWSDLKRAPRQSLLYGLFALLLCYGVGYAGLKISGTLVLLAMLSGLTLIGPVLAIGLYSISCQLDNGLVPVLGYCLRDSTRGLGNQGLFASVLIVSLVMKTWRRRRQNPLVARDAAIAGVLLAVATAVGALMPTPDYGILMPALSMATAAALWAVLVAVVMRCGREPSDWN